MLMPKDKYDEFYSALGRAITLFAVTEQWMKVFVGFLANTEDDTIGKIMTAQTPFMPLWHTLMSL